MRAWRILGSSLLFVAACGDGDTSSPFGGAGAGAATSSASTGAAGGTSTGTGTGTGGTGGGQPACIGKGGAPGDADLTLTSSGDDRDYRVHIPPGYDPAKPTPLVLALHGYTETIDDYATLTHYAQAADARGMIVVFPAGVAPFGVPGWNAGTCCGTAQLQNTPDVQFMRDLIDRLEADYCVDPRRVFATGFSNGGMLSHRLACELSDRIVAIGAVSGTIAVSDCAPARPVPVLHVHGTGDPIVPFDGGATAQSVPATISGWVTRNGCGATTTPVYDQGAVHCARNGGCQAGADVELCTIDGGGHEWPGGGSAMGSGDLDASAYILDFFAAHPLP